MIFNKGVGCSMRTAGKQEQFVELTREYPRGCHVAFDSEAAALEGTYGDELSAFRARKVWIDILESNFLLEKEHDFKTDIVGDIEKGSYVLRCMFSTACGRYAFWRLTNSQAPEAQYTIETAHIPNAESLYEQILRAPDLEEKRSFEIHEMDELFPAVEQSNRSSMVYWLKYIFRK